MRNTNHRQSPWGILIGCVLGAVPVGSSAEAEETRAGRQAASYWTDSSVTPLTNAGTGRGRFTEGRAAFDGGDSEFFGAHDSCSRGTLLQWSYGTNFSGGPALDEPLVTDRPDFTEASTTVGRGVLQIEAGYTFTYDAENGTSVRTHSFGEPLFRYGVWDDWLEFRVAVFPIEERTVTGGRRNTMAGTEDLYLGFKVALTPQEGILPEMALIPQTTVPTGSQAFSADEMLPGVNWIYAWEVNDFLSTAGSTQVNRSRDGSTGSTYYEFAQSWTAAYSLADRVGAYTEWFALIPSGADTERTEHYVNGGFTVLLNDDVQFDIRAGKGLNSAAADYFLGTGLSVRFR